MERLRVSTGDLLKFTLEFHVNQTLEFNLMMFGEDSNLKQKEENWNQLIKEKGLELINNSGRRCDSCKQNCVWAKYFYLSPECSQMLQAESLKKVLPGVKTVEEGKPSTVPQHGAVSLR
uniref:Uncharacterized protein n=1 Tax=Salix viminalis TaxID=40686 RepID=A0A6N2NGL3_SALVM